ncbi:MAG: hypothetical protein RIC87_07475 [Kiloniellales bacterium]
MSFFPSVPADDDLLGLWQRHDRGLCLGAEWLSLLLCRPPRPRRGLAHRSGGLRRHDYRPRPQEPETGPGARSSLCRDLALDPHKVSAAQAEAIYAAGFDEAALYDVINVAALYAFMNRMVEGSGIKRPSSARQPRSEVKRKIRYSDIWAAIARQKDGE